METLLRLVRAQAVRADRRKSSISRSRNHAQRRNRIHVAVRKVAYVLRKILFLPALQRHALGGHNDFLNCPRFRQYGIEDP